MLTVRTFFVKIELHVNIIRRSEERQFHIYHIRFIFAKLENTKSSAKPEQINLPSTGPVDRSLFNGQAT
jgi:hypothetical protein